MTAEILFWCAVALPLYAYLGYPWALWALALVRDRPVRKGGLTPPVSLIITAHNEERRIRDKIENTLGQDYPEARIEIIVASDCSTDRTDEVIGGYSSRVRLVRSSERRGKEAAQRRAIEEASGEILVFSDVTTDLAPGGVSAIVRNFADPTVGCVSSVDRLIDGDGEISGDGAYVRYEMFLRGLETRVNGLVGLSGCFFAARREVCRTWPADRESDFNTVLNAVEMGLRAVLDPESSGYLRSIVDERREFQRKVRTVVRGIAVLAGRREMLNPLRYGLFSWQLLSHKLCRWLVPFAMIAAGLGNVLLVSQSTLYLVTLHVQVGFYVAALAGIWARVPILRLPSFLLLANVAILMAWLRYARGERITTWQPSERLPALPWFNSR